MNHRIPFTKSAGLTETNLCKWIGSALPGDIPRVPPRVLAVDIGDRRLAAAEQKALRRVARRALWASDAGLVHLVQRRNGPNDFSSLAMARPRKRRATTAALIAEDVG